MRTPAPPASMPVSSPRRFYQAVVEKNEACAPTYRRIRYRLDGPVAFRAGQFCMVRGDWHADPLLARPMSVLWAGDERLDILLKVTGRGTALLAEARTGAGATLLAPLGNPFAIPDEPGNMAMLVGGGVGVPPIFALARELATLERMASTVVFLGGRTGEDVLLADDIRALGIEVITTTEDGSQGVKGLVTEPLRPRLAAAAATRGGATLYGCGPEGMLRALARLSAQIPAAVPYQAAVEQRMACGFGACLGCVLDMADGLRKLVCTDGPVLDGRALYGFEAEPDLEP